MFLPYFLWWWGGDVKKIFLFFYGNNLKASNRDHNKHYSHVVNTFFLIFGWTFFSWQRHSVWLFGSKHRVNVSRAGLMWHRTTLAMWKRYGWIFITFIYTSYRTFLRMLLCVTRILMKIYPESNFVIDKREIRR